MTRYLGIEGGGTTFRVAIAEGDPTNVVERTEVETTTPQETLGKVKEWISTRGYDAVGVACFGPIDVREGSPTWGLITTGDKQDTADTHTPEWVKVDIMGTLTNDTVPRAFDTDVNAPALAEYVYRKDKRQSSVAYITVGTGVGVGLVINGKTVHGLLHPEGGHVPCKRRHNDAIGDGFRGSCPFHQDCVEGLASAISIAHRKGIDRRALASLSDEDSVWDDVAHALASLCLTLLLTASPERIVMSGGVMIRGVLIGKIRADFLELLNGYIEHELLTVERIHEYITLSMWCGHHLRELRITSSTTCSRRSGQTNTSPCPCGGKTRVSLEHWCWQSMRKDLHHHHRDQQQQHK